MERQKSRSHTVILAAIVFSLPLLIGGPSLRAQADRKPEANTRQDRVFRAGAATSNITPNLGSAIVGGFLPFPAHLLAPTNYVIVPACIQL